MLSALFNIYKARDTRTWEQTDNVQAGINSDPYRQTGEEERAKEREEENSNPCLLVVNLLQCFIYFSLMRDKWRSLWDLGGGTLLEGVEHWGRS